LWIAGLDNPGKALSSERDLIYVNQAEELDAADWETLSTRATGRGAVAPWTQLLGDCNPGPPKHWIKTRQGLAFYESRHEDNPTLYKDGTWTEQGRKTLAVLDKLTGVRFLRLRKGIWAGAEGMVYDEYDPAIHLVDRFPIPADWRRIRSIDFGYTNPFVCQWWAIDHDGRMYLYRELYMTQRTVEEHAPLIVKHSEGEYYEATVADHDAEDRATLERRGVPTDRATKDISVGIQAVQDRLKVAGDGKPRLFILKNSLVEADEDLRARNKPISTEDEIVGYVWPKSQDNKPIKETPVDIDNHGMDTMRYAVMYVDHEPQTYTIRNPWA
jgi:phage terminase large subunit